ncbi:DUF429 domain-containing protein [Clostridium autoethanogenum]|uniref:DUF429 domain-containing protein n=1 Tax=Clostridium autoethanogenum TaxID=84023 RepID=A0A3M0SS62_9CLOT|nr:DUF429 domain-containing protein [Clostridium autoethanogenum]RMD01106.1 DUF429 domain-containing protein [Clostridium autoethanogenum]
MKFCGIDVHLRTLSIAEIDENFNVNLLKNMTLNELEEYIKTTPITLIGIDAPYNLNQGLMNDEAYRNKLGRKINGHYNKKVSEYELSRRGINPFSTPASMEIVRSKNYLSWMETGFKVYNILKEREFGLLNESNLNEKKDRGMIEVFPHACFTVLAGKLLSNKNTEKGINERINVIEGQGFTGIRDYIQNINKKYKDDFLDALIAAYTVYKIYNESGTFVGDIVEGQIALPVDKIKDSYKRAADPESNINKKEESVIIQFNKIYEYKVKHCDSVLWLKHFKPINGAPDALELLKTKQNEDINVIIVDENNEIVNVTLVSMKNRSDGLKVSDEYKKILKDFWGSSGDGKEYIIKIIF